MERLAKVCGTIDLVVILLGFVFGLVVGRWWAFSAAIALGVWIGLNTEVEVPAWFLGAAYAALTGAGIAAGIGLRKFITRSP